MARNQGGTSGSERWNVGWGRVSRGLAAAVVAVIALALPIGASADDGPPSSPSSEPGSTTHVGSALRKRAREHPTQMVRVIIQARDGVGRAEDAFKDVERAAETAGENAAKAARDAEKAARDAARASRRDSARKKAEADRAADAAQKASRLADQLAAGKKGGLKRKLRLVGSVAVELPAARVAKLAEIPGLVVTVDAPVRTSGSATYRFFRNSQVWPHKSGNAYLWFMDQFYADRMPTIAIVDSGVEEGRADLDGRVVADLKVNGGGHESGDSRGHGTFVAGIAAGSGDDFVGAAPLAKIFSVDVMDESGMAYTSDVIAACDLILQYKDTYNIRVANFSLHSSSPSSVRWDPLAKAVEKLWFSGVVVVASSGNYGSAEGPSGVHYAPGNDPFVITVGAADPNGGYGGWWDDDDDTAPWSAYGHTEDGFAKPELVAPGRYMVGPVPSSSSLARERPERLSGPEYMQLSGTSFAAPVVAGTAAQILARHPEWTPDQVKGALMLTAQPVPRAVPGAAGVGQVNALLAAYTVWSPPNPNEGLNQFLVHGSEEDPAPEFDAGAWGDAAWSSAAWSSAAWASAAWASAAWSSAAWASAAWASASWNSAAWSDAAWSDAAWGSTARGDSAEDDFNPAGPYYLMPGTGAPATAESGAPSEPDPGTPSDPTQEPAPPESAPADEGSPSEEPVASGDDAAPDATSGEGEPAESSDS
jgi:serine protease AprX